MRGKIAEAAVKHRALIKAIAEIIEVILPYTTLTQKVTTPRSDSAELGTQTVRNLTTPPQFVPLPSTSSAGDVNETETSPVSTRYAGATVVASDDDDDDDVDTGAVSEGEVHKFARKSFVEISSTYLSTYVHKSGVLDAEYRLRKVAKKFFIGNSYTTVDTNSDPYIRNKHFKGTRGLWEVLTRKNVNTKLVSEDGLKQYENSLDLTLIWRVRNPVPRNRKAVSPNTTARRCSIIRPTVVAVLASYDKQTVL